MRRHGTGLQACAKVRGERSFAQFPIDEKLSVITAWQADERARLRLLTKDRPRAGTLTADAAKYLRRADVLALADFAQREQHIQEWCAVFGARRRRSITTEMIREQRDRWLSEPRGEDANGTPLPPYSAASVNKRLRALSNLWSKLDGRRAPNPVLEVDECREPDPQARGLPYDVIEAILAAIPETGVGVRKDGTRTTGKNVPRPSQTKARLRVIAYTGLSHAELKRLTPEQVDLTSGTMLVAPREKGRKLRRAQDRPLSVLRPLTPQAVEAFRRFDELHCWGDFSNSSMWKVFQRACATLKITGLRPYDFRHSLLSEVYRVTKDLRVTGALGGHRSERTTRRYTLAAVAPHLQAAIDRLRDTLPPVAQKPEP